MWREDAVMVWVNWAFINNLQVHTNDKVDHTWALRFHGAIINRLRGKLIKRFLQLIGGDKEVKQSEFSSFVTYISAERFITTVKLVDWEHQLVLYTGNLTAENEIEVIFVKPERNLPGSGF